MSDLWHGTYIGISTVVTSHVRWRSERDMNRIPLGRKKGVNWIECEIKTRFPRRGKIFVGKEVDTGGKESCNGDNRRDYCQ